MNQRKVWVIGDDDWLRPKGKGRISHPASPGEKVPESRASVDCRTQSLPVSEAAGKNPALAFSLALLAWGSGHLYLKEYRTGALLSAAMFLFGLPVSLLLWGRVWLSGRFAAHPALAPVLLAAALAVSLAGMVFWLANAVAAYRRTVKQRGAPFLGLEHAGWPLACSLLFPGWGQFLNGQVKKGLCFLLTGLLVSFSALVTFIAWSYWPFVEPSPLRGVVDGYLAVALTLAPLGLAAWLVAAYDAYWSGKKLIRKRLSLKLPAIRAGGRGIVRNLVPRGTAVLGLLLALSLGMQFFPKGYYLEALEKVRLEMVASHLERVPELVRKVMDIFAP